MSNELDKSDDGDVEKIQSVNRSEDDYFDSNPLIDQILENNGYSLRTLRVFFIVALTPIVQGMHMSIFQIIFIPFREHFKLSDSFIGMISALIFISVGIGSLLVGYLTLHFKRTHLLIFSHASIFVFTLLQGVIDSYVAYIILRIIIGFFIGISVPIVICILAEYLPLYFRAFFLSVVWFHYEFGVILVIISSYIVMPKFESSNLLRAHLILAIIPFITTLIYIFFLHDSPRNLILEGMDEQAFRILDEMRPNNPLSDEEKKKVKFEVTNSMNKSFTKGNYFAIFTNDSLRSTSIFLLILWTTCALISYTPQIVITLTLKKIGLPPQNDNILLNMLGIIFITSISHFICILTEIKQIGRRYFLLSCYSIAGIILLIATFAPKHFGYIYATSAIFSIASYNIVSTYSNEFFPTKIRETANGIMNFATRLGGFASQLIGVEFNKISTFAPYYFVISMLIFGVVITIFLPHETYGHHLDLNIDREEKEQLKSKEKD